MYKDDFAQYQFIVYELVLPYCSVCTPISTETTSWHTPPLCEESSDSEYSLFFTKSNAPLMSPPSQAIAVKSRLNSSVFKCVTTGSEQTATLKPSEGLASRSTMSFSCVDFTADPGPINFTNGGTFFGKLQARNVLEGKKVVSHYYSMIGEEVTETYTSVHYITDTNLTGGKFSLKAKDALKDAEEYSEQFPATTEVALSSDIDSSTTAIPTTNGTAFTVGDIIRIDKELMRIQSISANTLNVTTRGESLIVDGYTIYKTDVANHSDEASIQICYQNNLAHISEVLYDIFVGIGLGDITDQSQWFDEIEEWNVDSTYIGLITEPTEGVDLINQILINYMLDMWLDQSTQKLTLSAVSAWKAEQRVLTEGLDFDNMAISKDSSDRFSRAIVYHQKDYKTEGEDIGNYSKWTLYKDESLEQPDFYGSIKVKEFDPCPFITSAAADVLVARYTQRFSETPKTITFDMEERKIQDIRLGTIVDLVSRESQTAGGEYLQARDRVQVIEMKPNLNKIGRNYSLKGLSYIPLIASDPSRELYINVSGSVFDLNLYSRAGNPSGAINVTYIFDGAVIGSTGYNQPSVRAGNFIEGTRIRIICINDVKWSARGGDGGTATILNSTDAGQGVSVEKGVNGSDCYWSEDVETEIYLNYSEVDGYTPLATLKAAGGGSGGVAAKITAVVNSSLRQVIKVSVAGGGSGGSGIPSGVGGIAYNYDRGDIRSGNDATAFSGASGYSISDSGSSLYSFGRPTATITAKANIAKGGGSSNSSLGSVETTATDNSSTGTVEKTEKSGAVGLAGAAIKGTGVTVYNNSSSRLSTGNSSSFALVSS